MTNTVTVIRCTGCGSTMVDRNGYAIHTDVESYVRSALLRGEEIYDGTVSGCHYCEGDDEGGE